MRGAATRLISRDCSVPRRAALSRADWPRRAAILLVALAALGAAPRAEAQAAADASGANPAGEATISGQVQQTASVATALSGAASFSGGAATSLSLALDARRASASLRASLHFSILYGNEAAALWTSLAASPSAGSSLLMAPAFDATAAAPECIALLALDELALTWDIGPFSFEAGKTIANWGVGKAFSPADFFAEFDYSSGSPTRRSGLLARATWFAGATSRVDLVYAPYAASANALAGAASSAASGAIPTSAIIAARAYATAFDSLAFALAAGARGAAGRSPASLLGALEVTFDLPFVSPYGEASIAAALDGSKAIAYSLLGGGQARIGDASLLAEYLYSPQAAAAHSFFALAGLPIDEWISISAPLLYYPESGALTVAASLAASDIAGLSLAITATASRSSLQAWSGKLALSARTSF
ncbi:MAG TPA: hypothetical protein VN445_14325 [Rectinemataceae bacterium]|nr:hypothetical protein [Rectinemataceae bacterium]